MVASPQLFGRTIAGRFRITGFIGEGAMAAVYLGEQDGEPREVAVKIMHPELLGDETFVGRFRREARAASKLSHPNTVRIIDYGVDEGLPFIVMERLIGRDLFELLAREHRLPEARSARILMGICEALEAAHAHGVVHRDLKPENIMIVADPQHPSAERVKVLDFGIAKVLHADPASAAPSRDDPPSSLSAGTLTRAGMAIGTPAYMSPEQCRGYQVDGRSDLYTCGVLLYLLVTGRLPFPASGAPWEVAMEHIRSAPPAPSGFVPGLHPALEAIILTALAKWPSQRQQSARELHDELARILPELPETRRAGAPAGPPPDAETLPISIRGKLGTRSAIEQHAVAGPPPPPAVRRFREDEVTAPVPIAPARPLLPQEEADATLDVDSGEPSLKTRLIPREMAEQALHREDEGARGGGSAAAPAPVPASVPPPARLSTVRPPRRAQRPASSLAARLVVPMALLVGVGVGLIAFLLLTR